MSKGLNTRKFHKGLCICLVLAGTVFTDLSCSASETGSLQIEYIGRTESDEEVLLDQAGFAYYYVGNIQDGQWKTTGAFEDSGVSLKEDISSERGKQAEELYQYAVNKKLPGDFTETDYKGIARIPGLKEGLYLVAQTEDWTSGTIGTFRSAPFLVSVPGMTDEGVTWNVIVKPKSEWVPNDDHISTNPENPEKPGTPEKPQEESQPEDYDNVKTGDTTTAWGIFFLLAGSLCLMIFIIEMRRRS